MVHCTDVEKMEIQQVVVDDDVALGILGDYMRDVVDIHER